MIISIVTLPRWLYSFYEVVTNEFVSFHGISHEEMASYTYLKVNTPKDSLIFIINQPHYIHYSSMVNVLSERPLFFSGEGVSQMQTQTMRERKFLRESVLLADNIDQVKQLLRKNTIDYMYIYGTPIESKLENLWNLEKVFTNERATIYRVK